MGLAWLGLARMELGMGLLRLGMGDWVWLGLGRMGRVGAFLGLATLLV